jgi:predicted ATPase
MWCLGECLAYSQATPYLPVRDLVQQFCAIPEGSPLETHMMAVRQRLATLGTAAEEDIAVLLQLLDLPVDSEILARLTPDARQGRTFTLLWHLLRLSAQTRPLVLAVENLHWIDPTSEAWLAFLVERLTGTAVLLLLTQRAELPATLGDARVGNPVSVAAAGWGGQPDHRGGRAGHAPALGVSVPADCGTRGG